uniref:Putative ovule protein n=1 Tax=Solanum chacoense TaxID=4108 RepID=A0A0V0GXH2_SOLCH
MTEFTFNLNTKIKQAKLNSSSSFIIMVSGQLAYTSTNFMGTTTSHPHWYWSNSVDCSLKFVTWKEINLVVFVSARYLKL